ncbi:ChbG/HpnK family deacetylase [Pseudodesulfovibrio tunisiensis]|uniref:ChbG/HpnK family deacetylase n=1 Tax=Pseudodesulfovibrio tunisiensis TaxID=463192 RepID=UPI001FB2F333|nr:ChbG/HpnK family deacetylase [Pseudodesulfovibrio tunisiensis]
MKVIVNVDDAGLHPAVRRGIETLSEAGIVTSATVMANGPDLDEALKLKGVGLGVHLNILRGRPVSPWQEVHTLVDRSTGLFLGDYTTLFTRFLAGRIDMEQVELEWGRQVDRILKAGVVPTHVDSEKHIHAWPAMTAAAGRVARRYGIGWMRRPVECAGLTRLDKGGIRTKFLRLCSLFQRRPQGMAWPDSIWGIADQGANLTPDRFRKAMAGRRFDIVEICCHPGLSLPGDPPISPDYGAMRVASQWQDELEALSDPEWLAMFRDIGAELVHFGHLR